jgi:hypothetical protein
MIIVEQIGQQREQELLVRRQGPDIFSLSVRIVLRFGIAEFTAAFIVAFIMAFIEKTSCGGRTFADPVFGRWAHRALRHAVAPSLRLRVNPISCSFGVSLGAVNQAGRGIELGLAFCATGSTPHLPLLSQAASLQPRRATL